MQGGREGGIAGSWEEICSSGMHGRKSTVECGIMHGLEMKKHVAELSILLYGSSGDGYADV